MSDQMFWGDQFLNLGFADREWVAARDRMAADYHERAIVIPGLPRGRQPLPPPFAKNLTDFERGVASSLSQAACQPLWLQGNRRCLVCCDLDFRRGKNGFSLERKARCFAHIRELSLAAWKGCPGCRFLWTVLFTLLDPQSIDFSPNNPMSLYGVVLESAVEGGPLTICWTDGFVNRYGGRIMDPRRQIEVYVPDYLSGEPSIWPALGIASLVCPAADPDLSIRRASEWLNECKASHPNCRVSPSPLPTRILRLESTGRGADISVSLHISRSGELGTYAALSHCWGSNTFITLKQSRLLAFQQDIPFSELPKTFQDATKITLGLGLSYLWVDSLCIIQDSEPDWKHESAQMGDIYAHSTITLAAESIGAHGIFGTGGSCVGRLPTFQQLFPIPSRNGGETFAMTRMTFKLADKAGEVAHRIVHGQTMTAWAPTMLDSRGWTLQERLLSPRVLHCSDGEFAWECLQHLRCECQAIPLPKQSKARYRKSLRNHLSTSSGDPAVPAFAWSKVVARFTARELTRQLDRLFAISGLAAMMGPRAEEMYMCGLWRDQLPLYLMWYRNARSRGYLYQPEIEEDKSKRLAGSYAPTWSWASITGRIGFHRAVERFETSAAGKESQNEASGPGIKPLQPAITILEIRYERSKINRFGPPLEAAILLSGDMSDGTIVRYQDMDPGQVDRIRYKSMEEGSPGIDISLGPTGTFLFPDYSDVKPPIVVPDVWCDANEIKTGDRVSVLWLWDDMALVVKEARSRGLTMGGNTATEPKESRTFPAANYNIFRRVGSISPKYGGLPKKWSEGLMKREIWLI